MVQAEALACELPATLGVPLSRSSTADVGREARRVFWIMDNGSSHRGQAFVQRLRRAFSILQRKTLTPNDFSGFADVEDRLLGFERYDESIATPCDWRFTKADLGALLNKLATAADALRPAAWRNTLPYS